MIIGDVKKYGVPQTSMNPAYDVDYFNWTGFKLKFILM